eukprot:Pgem_evm1s19559
MKFTFPLLTLTYASSTFAAPASEAPTNPDDWCGILVDPKQKLLSDVMSAYNMALDDDVYENDPVVWPQKTFVYDIEEKIESPPYKDTVLKDIEEALKVVEDAFGDCITFKREKKTTQRNHVTFVKPNNSGCSSYVGTVGSPQVINLGGFGGNPAQGCGTGSTIHEILHALGMYHTQTRPDAPTKITIYRDNIDPRALINFEPVDINTFGTEYTTKSIMHYGSSAFTKNGQPTILTNDGDIVQQNRAYMTEADIKHVRAIYQCDADTDTDTIGIDESITLTPPKVESVFTCGTGNAVLTVTGQMAKFGNQIYNTTTFEDCKKECAEKNTCEYIVFNKQDQRCYHVLDGDKPISLRLVGETIEPCKKGSTAPLTQPL